MDDIFSDYIINNYNKWYIEENGKYLYCNSCEGQQTIIYNTETKIISELSYNKNLSTGFQYVLFTDNNIIYNDNNNIIIEDYNHKIVKIIHNNGAFIIYLFKNDKYLFVDDEELLNIYCIKTFEHLYSFHFDNLLYFNVSNNHMIIYDSGIKIYSLDNFELSKVIHNNKVANISDIEIAINDKHFAIILNDDIIIYDLYGNELFIVPIIIDDNLYYLQYSNDNNYLYCGYNNKLEIYETNKYKQIKQYNSIETLSYSLTKDDYKILYINETKFDYIYTPKFHKIVKKILINNLPYELIECILLYL